MLLFGKRTTANLYSHLEYNAKVISAETIARVLDGDTEQQSESPVETVEPKKKSARKKSVNKKPTTKKISDEEIKTEKSEAKTTDNPAPKKRSRKKKSDTLADTSESQTSRL